MDTTTGALNDKAVALVKRLYALRDRLRNVEGIIHGAADPALNKAAEEARPTLHLAAEAAHQIVTDIEMAFTRVEESLGLIPSSTAESPTSIPGYARVR